MKIFLLSFLLLGTSTIFSQSDSLRIADISFSTEIVVIPDTAEISVMRIDIAIPDTAAIGKVTIDVLSLPDHALLYKREYTRVELSSLGLWTSAGLTIRVPDLEAGEAYEVRATVQNLQMAFFGQLINNYPF